MNESDLLGEQPLYAFKDCKNNTNGTFPFHKSCFIVEKGSLDFLNVLHTEKKSRFF